MELLEGFNSGVHDVLTMALISVQYNITCNNNNKLILMYVKDAVRSCVTVQSSLSGTHHEILLIFLQ